MMSPKVFYVQLLLICCIGCQGNKQNQTESEPNVQAEQQAGLVGGVIDTENDEFDREFDKEYEISELHEENGYWRSIPASYRYYFEGEIGDNRYCDFYLQVDSTTAKGHYTYENVYMKQKQNVSFEGTLIGRKLRITEKGGNSFKGLVDRITGHVDGKWYSADGKTVSKFRLWNPSGTGYPKLTYKVHVEEAEHNSVITEIQVRAAGYLIAQFSLKVEMFPWNYQLIVQDFNFDGYQDIALMCSVSDYPPMKYAFFLYEPEGQYYYQTDMYDHVYTLPSFIDYRKKMVFSTSEGGSYYHQIYKYEDEKLHLIYNQHYSGHPTEEDSHLVETYYKIKNGETIKISEDEYRQLYEND